MKITVDGKDFESEDLSENTNKTIKYILPITSILIFY